MLLRDRVSCVGIKTSLHLRPSPSSTACTTQSSFATSLVPPLHGRYRRPGQSYPQRFQLLKSNFSSTSWICQASSPSSLATTISPLDDLPSSASFNTTEDIRSYLKKWSQQHQKSLKENAPDRVQLQRDAILPNSLFIRNNSEVEAEPEKELIDADTNSADSEIEYDGTDEAEISVVTSRPRLQPGDAFRITAKNVRTQLAIFLGSRGVQSLYFLADGRWFATCRTSFDSHIVRGFATPNEMAQVDKYLPLRTVEYVKAEEGATVPFSVTGEIQHKDSRALLDKLAMLAQEVEVARRDYPAVNDRLYDAFADEVEFKQERLERLVHDVLHADYDTFTEGAKMFLHDEVSQDERIHTWAGKTNRLMLQFLPRRMHQSVVQATQWARSYQDAAARAAIGKSVSEELKGNPLIPFISKARRLISKSRKIRLPTMECQLGPTLENVRPPTGVVERRPTGEEFTEDEKKIIEFLWLIYAKKPPSQAFGAKRNAAIASLVVRAVGAYPNFRLDAATGLLFLKELGCLDPWATTADFFVDIPSPLSIRHQDSRLRKEQAQEAVVKLGLQRDDEKSKLPDTMAHLRTDWGGLDVFCIDSLTTVVVDDGISVEESKEHPGHYWLRVHMAHLSAFVLPGSPLLALAPLMGASHYHAFGCEPYIPYDAVIPCSVKANRPVLTVSTLLSPSGSIKDIDVRPGIVRNVTNIHSDIFQKVFHWGATRNIMYVGPRNKEQWPKTDSTRSQEQLQLIERHRATFELVKKVLKSRWQARYREMPDHLHMLKMPNTNTKIMVEPTNVVWEGKGYDRIFRSEHLVGDITMKVSASVADFDGTTRYRNQQIQDNIVAMANMLACEATAIWAAARDIPIIYRSTQSPGDAELSKLNNMGRHDAYVAPPSAEGVDIAPSVSLATAGYANVNNPLRRYRDLKNHHQVDAYLKGQAEERKDGGEGIRYPWSREDLKQAIYEESDGGETVKSNSLYQLQSLHMALYRAFYFQEAKLPEIWDVYIDNPVNLGGSKSDEATTTKGTIYALGIKVQLQPCEQGWEKAGKFRQWIPCKLISINPSKGLIICQAVGPPSDQPSVKDLAYPDMQIE